MASYPQIGERFDIVVPTEPAIGNYLFFQKAGLFILAVLFSVLWVYWVATGQETAGSFMFWFTPLFIAFWLVVARVALADIGRERTTYVELRSDGLALSWTGKPVEIPFAKIRLIELVDVYTLKDKFFEGIAAGVDGRHVAIWKGPRTGIIRLMRGGHLVERVSMPDDARFVRLANEKLAAWRLEHGESPQVR